MKIEIKRIQVITPRTIGASLATAALVSAFGAATASAATVGGPAPNWKAAHMGIRYSWCRSAPPRAGTCIVRGHTSHGRPLSGGHGFETAL